MRGLVDNVITIPPHRPQSSTQNNLNQLLFILAHLDTLQPIEKPIHARHTDTLQLHLPKHLPPHSISYRTGTKKMINRLLLLIAQRRRYRLQRNTTTLQRPSRRQTIPQHPPDKNINLLWNPRAPPRFNPRIRKNLLINPISSACNSKEPFGINLPRPPILSFHTPHILENIPQFDYLRRRHPPVYLTPPVPLPPLI
ncbi:hypothetical protein LXL04_029665 [Taraxacum kok-saghyz]